MPLRDVPISSLSETSSVHSRFGNDVLEYALNASLIGFWAWDIEQDLLFRSKRVDQILMTDGSEMQETISAFQSRLHPDDKADIKKDILNYLEDKRLFDKEYRFKRGDGSYIWIGFRAEGIWEKNKPVRIAGSFFDISDQIAIREEQQKRESELRLIFDNVPAKIWYKDDKNTILRLNKRAADSMGLDVKEAEGASTYDLFPEMAKKYHEDDLQVINSGEAMLGIVEEYTPKDEPKGWVQTDKIPYTDPVTGESFLFVSSMDITALKKAEEAIRESEERLNLILENSYDGVWDWYIQDNYEYMSPRFWEMFGIDHTTKRHHPDEWQDIIFEDDLKIALKNFEKHVETRGQHPYHQEVRYKHADGSTVTVLCRGRVVEWDDDGNAVRMIGTHTDVTQLKKTNKALEDYTRKLEEANEELDHFAYVASHDLKAPLRGIDNIASWIEEDLGDTLTPDIKSKIDLMRGRISRLETLLKDILAFSRAGRQLSQPEIVDSGKLVDEVIGWIQVPETFTINKTSDFPELFSVRTVLEHIFLNLISNAVKHHDMEDGNIQLSCEDKDFHYDFAVKDDGPGIPPQFHDRVFQIFKTLQSRDEVEGSGIGLSIVKKMVLSIGGEIWIESQAEERGTAFHFTVPKSTLNRL
jgi:PAS domain S-box-containing protein